MCLFLIILKFLSLYSKKQNDGLAAELCFPNLDASVSAGSNISLQKTP